jgi:hypothetical protein
MATIINSRLPVAPANAACSQLPHAMRSWVADAIPPEHGRLQRHHPAEVVGTARPWERTLDQKPIASPHPTRRRNDSWLPA